MWIGSKMTRKNEFGQPIGDLLENWQPAKRPVKESIQGKFCILTPLDPDKHAAYLFSIFEKKGWTYLPYGPFSSVEEFHDWLRITPVNDDPFFYAVLDIETKQPNKKTLPSER
jgi:hypothetical protein